ncbi:MAG TPA: YggS family pyridoxal phosphate-dependent enzyme [Flavisolibacter sp.]|nr:YggS family pyridoxal phosphate-dependent enzyme [Flavisolibacter sp.]
MSVDREKYFELQNELSPKGVILIAVSKTKPPEDILELYELGHRDFGENYVQELLEKQSLLPKDIRWHFIGHLQSNKVKYIAPFVHLIHGIDSLKILREVEKQGQKLARKIDVLLQVHIAREESKFGLDTTELDEVVQSFPGFNYLNIKGVMGMASLTDDIAQINSEFNKLKLLFEKYKILIPSFSILSMGMSGDYKIAVDQGSNMVRIGSLLFGERNYAR